MLHFFNILELNSPDSRTRHEKIYRVTQVMDGSPLLQPRKITQVFSAFKNGGGKEGIAKAPRQENYDKYLSPSFLKNDNGTLRSAE